MSAKTETLKELAEKLEQANIDETRTFLVADCEDRAATLTIPVELVKILDETTRAGLGWYPALQGRDGVEMRFFVGNIDGMAIRGCADGDWHKPSIIDVTDIDLSRPFRAGNVTSDGLTEITADLTWSISVLTDFVCVSSEDLEDFRGAFFAFDIAAMANGTAPKTAVCHETDIAPH